MLSFVEGRHKEGHMNNTPDRQANHKSSTGTLGPPNNTIIGLGCHFVSQRDGLLIARVFSKLQNSRSIFSPSSDT